MAALMCPSILERRQYILIGLSVSVGVPLSDVCVRNGTRNAAKRRMKRELEQFKWLVYRHYFFFWRYFGSYLLVYDARFNEKRAREREERKWNLYTHFDYDGREKKVLNFAKHNNHLFLSLSLSLSLSCFSLIIKFHRNRKKKKR